MTVRTSAFPELPFGPSPAFLAWLDDPNGRKPEMVEAEPVKPAKPKLAKPEAPSTVGKRRGPAKGKGRAKLAIAHKPKGTLYTYDHHGRRVKVGADGKTELIPGD